MSKQIKIVHGQNAGSVVNGINKLLDEGWRFLETDTVVTSLRLEFGRFGTQLVPEFVVYLVKDGEP